MVSAPRSPAARTTAHLSPRVAQCNLATCTPAVRCLRRAAATAAGTAAAHRPAALQAALPGVGAPSLRVVVASQNAVKINAVAAALRQALPGMRHAVAGSESRSGVPNQPFGDEETLRGAFNRVQSICLPQHEGSLLVAIEGGVGLAAPLPALPPQQGAAPPADVPSRQQQWAAARQQPRQQHAALQPPIGTHQRYPELECYAWVVVQAPCGAISHARSASFPLPPAVSELMLRDGLELGAADDAVFGRRVAGPASRAAGWRVAAPQALRPACSAFDSCPCQPSPLPPPPRCRRRVQSGRGSGTIGQLTHGLLSRRSYYEHAVLCALVPLMNGALYPDFDLSQLPALAPAQQEPPGGAPSGE